MKKKRTTKKKQETPSRRLVKLEKINISVPKLIIVQVGH
jgi:hypothetical protein